MVEDLPLRSGCLCGGTHYEAFTKDMQQIKDIFQNKFSILENSCKELEQNWPNVAKYIKTSSRLPIEGIDYN